MNKKTILIILDGWGLGNGSESDIINNAKTPFTDSLYEKYPHSKLETSGENVGLPEGQMGNSEVGHMNIGAGRIVYQDLVKINKAVQDGSIKENPVLKEAFEYAKKNDKKVHFLGLVSDGGVHSSQEHLHKLCEISDEYGIKNAYVHAITDGRDTDPRSGKGFIQKLQDKLNDSNVQIASLIGRYYTMDRDKRWERIKLGYDLMTKGKGRKSQDPVKAVQESYDDGITDEFIKPITFTDENLQPRAIIEENDVVICFNFRTDRLRQITTALTQEDMPEEDMKTMPLHYLTMTQYNEDFEGIKVIFEKEKLQNTIGEVLDRNGKKQLRIAETEKFAHVTFFLSGGKNDEFEGESRILVPSPKVATYDLQPEMSAPEVTEKLTAEIATENQDFICLNFANGDMVGHTGIYEAIQKAVEAVDGCLEKVVNAAQEHNYSVMIIADHGNADNAVNEDGSPNTAHSLNPVPCIVIDPDIQQVENGILADVAPTLLNIMNLDIPEEMTGKVLTK
jgi:2,3-bisphosphoglycerate-independent phosphoglycerate mutase